MHVIICIIAMLALSMALAIGYPICDESPELVIRAYLRPVVRCLRLHQLQGGRGSVEDLACVQEWRRDMLPDMLQRLGMFPYYQPVVYLRVGDITFHGRADAYKEMFRRKPKSYDIRNYNDFAAEMDGAGTGGGEAAAAGGGVGRGGNVAVTIHVGKKEAKSNESRENLCVALAVEQVRNRYRDRDGDRDRDRDREPHRGRENLRVALAVRMVYLF